MKILLKKINKKGFHFIKCDRNNKKREKLGSFSRYGDDYYIRLNFRRLYYYVRGGAKFKLNKTYLRTLGEFDLFDILYNYESKKNTDKSGKKG